MPQNSIKEIAVGSKELAARLIHQNPSCYCKWRLKQENDVIPTLATGDFAAGSSHVGPSFSRPPLKAEATHALGAGYGNCREKRNPATLAG